MARNEWQIQQHSEDGTVSLVKGRKVRFDHVQPFIVDHFLKKNVEPGCKVVQVEADGYRIDLTRQYAPAHRQDGTTWGPAPRSPSGPRRRAPVRMPLMRF